MEHLRPVTPTGSVVDESPDIWLVRSKPTSPAVQELDPPHTPGTGILVELDCAEGTAEPVLASSTQLETWYQDRPRTPGRESRNCWTFGGSGGEADREMAEGSTLTWLPAASYVRAPKTPGRDIILPQRDTVYNRKTARNPASHTLVCDSHGASSPCRVSDSSSSSSDARESWMSSGVCAKPLRGLENMPGLLCRGSWTETEESFFKRRQRRLKRRWRLHRRLIAARRAGVSRSCRRRRSPSEERRVLHRVWKDGLDEEDARLLCCTYNRLQTEDCGSGWVNDTLWTPHPHILSVVNVQRRTCVGFFFNPFCNKWFLLS